MESYQKLIQRWISSRSWSFAWLCSENGSGAVKKEIIKKIEPTVTENNVVNLEVSKKEPKIFDEGRRKKFS